MPVPEWNGNSGESLIKVANRDAIVGFSCADHDLLELLGRQDCTGVKDREFMFREPFFEIFIAEEEINFAIESMAKQIEADFFDDVPVFIGVLNGSFMVISDLLKKYKAPCEVSFVKMASYEGMQTTNEIKQLIGVNQNLQGRSVIVVEDIVDTGNTIEEFKALLKEHHVKHFTIYLPRKINNTLMSAGETPLILPACAMVFGFILSNFCLASAEREVILE